MDEEFSIERRRVTKKMEVKNENDARPPVQREGELYSDERGEKFRVEPSENRWPRRRRKISTEREREQKSRGAEGCKDTAREHEESSARIRPLVESTSSTGLYVFKGLGIMTRCGGHIDR